eukprot:NODE_1_length_95616_cov_0.657642.p52 type:complete len:216 gc:universal NODE_1_length_95616_cov_0.657642:70978-70331(-)
MLKGLRALKTFQIYFATTAGRDKVYRSVQYLCRFLVQHTTGELQEKFRSIMISGSLTRKWLRLFRLDFFVPLVEETQNFKGTGDKDPVVRFLSVARNISMQFFFYCDHALLFNGLRLYSPSKDRLKSIKEFHMRFWAFGIVLSLIKQLHLTFNYPQRQQLIREKLISKKSLFMDFIDLMIPLNSLGYTSFSESSIGLFGTITALNGVYDIAKNIK